MNTLARPGAIRVEALDFDGAPIEGFTRGAAEPIQMVDSLDAAVTWKSGHRLEELSGKPIQLRFHVQASKLYSFWAE